MGRNSGFIAMQASLASGQVDICLIPEVLLCYYLKFQNMIDELALRDPMHLKVPFNLHGPNGVLKHLKYLIETKGSAVICVAEGAGQVTIIQPQIKELFPLLEFFVQKLYLCLHFLGMLFQNFLEKTNAKDASGNAVLGDFGVYIQQEVRYKQHLVET